MTWFYLSIATLIVVLIVGGFVLVDTILGHDDQS